MHLRLHNTSYDVEAVDISSQWQLTQWARVLMGYEPWEHEYEPWPWARAWARATAYLSVYLNLSSIAQGWSPLIIESVRWGLSGLKTRKDPSAVTISMLTKKSSIFPAIKNWCCGLVAEWVKNPKRPECRNHVNADKKAVDISGH